MKFEIASNWIFPQLANHVMTSSDRICPKAWTKQPPEQPQTG